MARNPCRWPLTLALCGGYFLVLLDVTVVNVALPQIGAELHAGSGGLAWTVDAYSVPLAALLLASGAIGDLIGHRRVVLLGLIGFRPGPQPHSRTSSSSTSSTSPLDALADRHPPLSLRRLLSG
ncbi:MFS transporter [Streptomyces sp. NPDC049954]|uniref:MFS transporter n=1 Tax=Streptomyces sp. NPDC049954 TaxID=3155779 RepID=UPI0034132F92